MLAGMVGMVGFVALGKVVLDLGLWSLTKDWVGFLKSGMR